MLPVTRARPGRSGRLVDGELDLAIDLDGTLLGRIQTFVPPGRLLPSGTFDVGIGLREHARSQGHGREAIALLTRWLFEQAAAQVVEGITDPANTPMRAVFQRLGWGLAGSQTEFGRDWAVYRAGRGRWSVRPGR
jgi:RimJ/RimL family protein N-acetyltransferase